ncbi:MAG: hypothetical protein EXR47_03570 [Dehalococcoidia bacterium]|nr:hypothetical protein [Dehalococcoidia bacterium]
MATARKATRKPSPKPAKAAQTASDKKREWLRGLVGKLPPGELEHAQRYLEFMVATTTDDPVLRSVLLAPEDDEPETPAERAAVKRGKADIKAGRFYTLEEVKRELGL